MTENYELGKIVRGRDIGRVASSRFIWARCPDCFEERWVHYSLINNGTLRICKDCALNRAKSNFYVGGGLEHKPRHKKKTE